MCSFETDFGWMRPISDGSNLIRLDWNQTGWNKTDRPDSVSRETKSQLTAFFFGNLRQFSLPLSPIVKTAAGQLWLTAMAKIPYGTIMTYAQFADLAGKPKAARAAGLSCAKNPIPIIYPCHRVVQANGTLGNFSGGSGHHSAHGDNMSRKTALLNFEFSHIASKV